MSCRRTPQPVPGTVWRWNQSLHKVLGILQKLSTQHPWRALASAQKVQALCSHQGFGAKTRTRGWELPRAVDEGPQTAAEAPQAVPADLSLEHEVWLHSGRFFLFRLPPGRKWAAYKELIYIYSHYTYKKIHEDTSQQPTWFSLSLTPSMLNIYSLARSQFEKTLHKAYDTPSLLMLLPCALLKLFVSEI